LFVAPCVGDVAWLKLAGMLLQFLTYDKFDEVLLRFLFIQKLHTTKEIIKEACPI
jgi:hypothetical protein